MTGQTVAALVMPIEWPLNDTEDQQRRQVRQSTIGAICQAVGNHTTLGLSLGPAPGLNESMQDYVLYCGNKAVAQGAEPAPLTEGQIGDAADVLRRVAQAYLAATGEADTLTPAGICKVLVEHPTYVILEEAIEVPA